MMSEPKSLRKEAMEKVVRYALFCCSVLLVIVARVFSGVVVFLSVFFGFVMVH